MSIPPIVLVVALEEAVGGSYSAALEEAGFWVAESDSLESAGEEIVDLQPDVVVTDLSAAESRYQTEALVRTLKAASAASAVPLIIVQPADTARVPLPELDALDARLVKPVSPPVLRGAVERAMVASRAVRRRRKFDPISVPKPLGFDEPTPQPVSEPAPHTCPVCGRALEWTERRTVGGIEYDYFHWCEGGCGLYCFGVTTGRWLKLV